MEIQGGGSKDYERVIKECEEAISLEEVGISPISIRRTRGGGILLEIKGDREEEKAELLANRIKEVIKKNEGALDPQEEVKTKTNWTSSGSQGRGDRNFGREEGGR